MRHGRILLAMVAVLLVSLTAGKAPAADSLNAVWVHGNVAEAEAPWNLESTAVRGWGIFFTGKENSFNWFHIPISTPVITESTRVRLEKFFLRFKTFGDCTINNIHVWDGNTRIIAKDGLSLSGDHLSTYELGINAFDVSPLIGMSTGMEIAVGVKFGVKSPGSPKIQFSTAGADFHRFW